MEEHPIQTGVNGQYEKIAKAVDTTAETVRYYIKAHKLAPNVKFNSQAKRFPITFVDNVKSNEETALERAEFWREMEIRSTSYIKDWKTDNIINIKIDEPVFFGIAVMSDSHIGGEGCDYTKMRIDAEAVRDCDYMGVIHAGDLIDNFISPKIQEAVINATTSPKQQCSLLSHWIDTMTPEKILAVVGGNHDLRTKDVSGIDAIGNLIRAHKVHYCAHEFVINFIFPSGVTYQLYMRHKYSFQSRINLTNCAKQLLRNGIYDSDIIIVAHNHEDAWETFNWRGNRRIAIRPSSYKVSDPYSRKMGFNDSSATMPAIIFNPYEKHIEILDSIEEASKYLKFKNEKFKD